MSCNSPRIMSRHAMSGEVRFGEARPGFEDVRTFEVPCGKCMGCRMMAGLEWKIRILHESQTWDWNLILTLTYAPEFMPRGLSLEYSDFQGFMKRLRARVAGQMVGPDGRRPIRFFVVGEYGGQFGRPHFHACMFNLQLADLRQAGKYMRSELANELWEKGHVSIDRLTPAGAAYVAGYVKEKARGSESAERYEDVLDPRTGELSSRVPEFVRMSLKPGIGGYLYQRFPGDFFPADHAVLGKDKHKVPRYYWKLLQRSADPGVLEEIRAKRLERCAARKADQTPERRAVAEELAIRRAARNERRL